LVELLKFYQDIPEAELDPAREEGILYVYIGNVAGHPANSTYCPKCGEKLIERTHFVVLKNRVKDGICPLCKERIPGIWKRRIQGRGWEKGQSEAISLETED